MREIFGDLVEELSVGQPRRRGRSRASIAIVDASVRILEEIAPCSVRAVCYRLFTEQLIPNMSKASTNKVSGLLTRAREEGLIPWDSIVDETRKVEQVNAWSSPDMLVRAAVQQYRKDYWQWQPNVVEVWSEKGTVRGTLAPVLDQYGVAFRVMHGYGSATALHDIAEQSAESRKPTHALYVGDWDPSGLHMSEVDLPRRVSEYGGKVTLHRVALTQSDTQTGLPSFAAETKRGDPRHHWFTGHYGNRCWELDALSPPLLRERVERAIHALLDLDQWNSAVQVEAVERDSMQQFLNTWSKSMHATNCSEQP